MAALLVCLHGHDEWQERIRGRAGEGLEDGPEDGIIIQLIRLERGFGPKPSQITDKWLKDRLARQVKNVKIWKNEN